MHSLFLLSAVCLSSTVYGRADVSDQKPLNTYPGGAPRTITLSSEVTRTATAEEAVVHFGIERSGVSREAVREDVQAQIERMQALYSSLVPSYDRAEILNGEEEKPLWMAEGPTVTQNNENDGHGRSSGLKGLKVFDDENNGGTDDEREQFSGDAQLHIRFNDLDDMRAFKENMTDSTISVDWTQWFLKSETETRLKRSLRLQAMESVREAGEDYASVLDGKTLNMVDFVEDSYWTQDESFRWGYGRSQNAQFAAPIGMQLRVTAKFELV